MSAGAERPLLDKCGGAVRFVDGAAGKSPIRVEAVAHGGVEGGELVEAAHPPEPLHRRFALSEKLVEFCGSVVRSTISDLPILGSNLLGGSLVGLEPICDQPLRPTMPLHQLTQVFGGGLLIPRLGHERLQDSPSWSTARRR